MTTLVLLGLVLLFIGLIFVTQRKQIYFPRPYGPEYLVDQTSELAPVRYGTEHGEQAAFYFVPGGDATKPVDELWVTFGGNAMLALDWVDWLSDLGDGTEGNGNEGDATLEDGNRRGFLLVDYPGYGRSGGKPTRESIIANTEAVLPALAESLETDAEQFRSVNVLGLSIGAAAGLEFAVRHEVDRVVLLAPFTSLLDMAKRQVGPLAYMLLDRFDNRARLAELAGREHRPEVVIFHGNSDGIIPLAHGRSLAGEYPDWIRFHEVPGADHNDLLYEAEGEIKAAVRGEGES